jgi:hypothetical protein
MYDMCEREMYDDDEPQVNRSMLYFMYVFHVRNVLACSHFQPNRYQAMAPTFKKCCQTISTALHGLKYCPVLCAPYENKRREMVISVFYSFLKASALCAGYRKFGAFRIDDHVRRRGAGSAN